VPRVIHYQENEIKNLKKTSWGGGGGGGEKKGKKKTNWLWGGGGGGGGKGGKCVRDAQKSVLLPSVSTLLSPVVD